MEEIGQEEMTYCGVLNVDKPAGVTSRDIVNQVVRLVRPAKAGHAGTLDPLATGVLVVCVGHATRLINLVQEGRKRYLGRFALGQTSDTDDVTGNLQAGGDWSGITKAQLQAELTQFVGRIDQTPPQFSAVHVQGQRAYDLARRGVTVELAARPVDIFSLELTAFQPPEFELDVICGGGTYIRSIGRDLGARLGCGALMTDLRRLAVGHYEIANAVQSDQITAESIGQMLRSPLEIVSHLPRRELTQAEAIAVRCGQSIAASDPATNDSDLNRFERRTSLVDSEGQLVGVGELDAATERLQPRIIFPAS
ncbi:tRNA pseudouridine(55) synthase TruB [Schlesneria paludicola]|uniref:tRNA pseudouridine(55) synthase TruB n=1 Tax=Schlesneria paludicola TaxID=360056 RepID=UPI00029A0641|nr:tRNA pseudouridine(55) synthase TruB [Schlesneria paludicola]